MTKQHKWISLSVIGIIAAAVLLANPVWGLTDVLPDVIAWAIVWFALRIFSELNESMTQARRLVLYLLGISAAKILMWQSVSGSEIRSDSMLATFVFALLEGGCLVLFFRSFLKGAEELARVAGCERMYVGADNLRFLSVLFAVTRSVCNFLPELTALPDWYVQYGEVTDDGLYNLMVQFAGATDLLSVICSVPVLIVAVIWLVSFLPLVNLFAKDEGFVSMFASYLETDSDEKRIRRTVSYLHMARLCIGIGLVFAFDLLFDGLRVLPICMFPALMACGCLFLQKLAGVKCYKTSICLASASAVVLLLAEVYRRYFTVWDARVYAEIEVGTQLCLALIALGGMGLLMCFWLHFAAQTEALSASFGCGEVHLSGMPYVLLVLLALGWTAVYVLPVLAGTLNFVRLAVGAVFWFVANRRLAALEENIRERISLGFEQNHDKIR